jgi:TonB family protein
MIDSGQNRAFRYAILASLALHALLLFVFPDLFDPARRAVRFAPPIIARLMEPEPASPPAAAVETPPAAPPQKSEPPKVAAAKRAPERAREPQPVRTPAQQAPAPASKPEPAAPSAEAGASPSAAAEPELAPPSIASVQPGPVPAAPSAEAPESLSRDQYRIELIGAAKRIKDEMRYPPLARENNWEGGVLVAVAIAANGRPSIAVKGSSGYEVLDRHALEIFRRATRAVPVPPPLRGKEFALEVQAIFNLEN